MGTNYGGRSKSGPFSVCLVFSTTEIPPGGHEWWNGIGSRKKPRYSLTVVERDEISSLNLPRPGVYRRLLSDAAIVHCRIIKRVWLIAIPGLRPPLCSSPRRQYSSLPITIVCSGLEDKPPSFRASSYPYLQDTTSSNKAAIINITTNHHQQPLQSACMQVFPYP